MNKSKKRSLSTTTPTQRKKKNKRIKRLRKYTIPMDKKEEEEWIGLIAGGVTGGLIAGPVGALVGGAIGFFAALMDKSSRKAQK